MVYDSRQLRKHIFKKMKIKKNVFYCMIHADSKNTFLNVFLSWRESYSKWTSLKNIKKNFVYETRHRSDYANMVVRAR